MTCQDVEPDPPTLRHEPRIEPSSYYDLGWRRLRPSTGPMGLRCLYPIDTVPMVEGLSLAACTELTRCAFEGCVCRCHS